MIHFVGNVQSKFGRGKDKTKRKSRVNPLVGAGLGTVAGGPVGSIAGALIAKGVNKERDRFDKEGARSHLGKVGHDARLGAKSVGIGSAVIGGLAGAALGSSLPTHRKKGFLGLSRDKKAEARDRLKNTLMGAGLGVIGGGVSGAINGAGAGALVGAGRGFVQENKSNNKKKKGNFNQYIDAADFAFGLSSKPTRLQTINNARKKGADATGNFLGAMMGGTGASKMLSRGGSIKGKVARAALMGTVGAVAGKTSGGLVGGTVGTGVGGVKALLQPRKKKLQFNNYNNFISFEAPYYSTSKYDSSKPYTPPTAKPPKPKKSRLGKIGKKAFKFISRNPGKVGLGIAAGTIAAGVVNNQIQKSRAKKQNPFNKFVK